jgi:hypothetical protein
MMKSAHFLIACMVFAVVVSSPCAAAAQGDDNLVNGTLIGGAVGAAAGVAFGHVVRDSDLSFGQYAYGALVFGAIGAGIGLGVDALLDRGPSHGGVADRRVVITPSIWRGVKAVAVKFRW